MVQPTQLTRSCELTLDRAAIDKTARTVKASISSEQPVMRYGVPEVLRHDSASVDLGRAANGLPLLLSHDARTLPIGIAEHVRLEGKRLVADLRFGQSARAQEVFDDVIDGIVRAVSISYSIERTEANPMGGLTAVRWGPHEVSLVAVAADATVGVGRSAEHDSNPPGTTMTETTVDAATAAERVRAAEISNLCNRHSVPAEQVARYLSEGTPVDAVRVAVLDDLARRDALAGNGQRNVAPASWILGCDTAHQTRRDAMSAALAARMGGPALTAENQYRHCGVIDCARELLEINGIRTTSLSRSQIIERAMSTSDLPELLTGTGQRTLRAAYSAYLGGLRRACRQSSAPDFRAKQRLALSEAPALLLVGEHSEFKYGSMSEAKESYRLATYGRIFGITRQALVNDDLGAFSDMAQHLGRAAAEFEAQFLAALLVSNPTMGDGIALFNAAHSNVGTGAASALSLTSLAAARKALRLQKGMDGTTAIDAQAKFLICPAALELTAEQLLAQLSPTTVAEANPFAGRLELVVDPRLDATSSTAWFLAADPNALDTIEYSYLDSAGGPEVFTQEGWTTDGMEFKVRLDYGAAALGWRGLYKAVGA